ncbi:hypothetical protein FRC10_000243 [Ceratobasidium sp. 414]|nr:hypothetical protein FRC10_000243 [Ceratobasidium sp. 414]
MSDKTNLTERSGGKKAWPVYITIGNINKDIRRQPSKHAVILLGYLPIPAGLSEDGDQVSQGEWAWEIFHKCMSKMVEPLVEVSRNGVELWCSDGGVRRCYPFLAAYVADYPEQNLVTCTSGCPICEEPKEGRGDLGAPAPLRTRNSTLRALEEAEVGQKVGMNKLGLRNIWPFWTNLPLTNISASITPDLLHQLHKGMFLDHLVKWCKQLMGGDEMDRRFMAMTRYHGTRHFANGITGVSQWTGREAKEMARVFMSVIDGAVPPKAVCAARALIHFMFLAHASTLTDLELDMMDEWLVIFHANKDVFRKRPDGTDRDFDLIHKLHMLRHHTYSIRELGTPDGTNTEMSEFLHIPLAKVPYQASNKVEPMEQMTKHVQRNNAVARRRFYLQINGRLHLKFTRSRADKDGVDGSNEEEKSCGGACGGDKRESARPDPGVPTEPFVPEPRFSMSKRSTWPHRAGSTLIDAHEASNLIPAVNDFLDKIPLLRWSASMRPRILETHLFPSWSRCTLGYSRLPFKPSEPAKSAVVQAAPATLKNGKQTRPACFDTVLVRCCPEKRGLAIPRFGSLLPGVTLTNSTDTLDAFREFSFNPYADYFLFSVMHHWEQCLTSK